MCPLTHINFLIETIHCEVATTGKSGWAQCLALVVLAANRPAMFSKFTAFDARQWAMAVKVDWCESSVPAAVEILSAYESSVPAAVEILSAYESSMPAVVETLSAHESSVPAVVEILSAILSSFINIGLSVMHSKKTTYQRSFYSIKPNNAIL